MLAKTALLLAMGGAMIAYLVRDADLIAAATVLALAAALRIAASEPGHSRPRGTR